MNNETCKADGQPGDCDCPTCQAHYESEMKIARAEYDKAKLAPLNLLKISNIRVENVDTHDYPDFCDAYIASADYTDETGETRELTDTELDWLNDTQGEFVYKHAYESIF